MQPIASCNLSDLRCHNLRKQIYRTLSSLSPGVLEFLR